MACILLALATAAGRCEPAYIIDTHVHADPQGALPGAVMDAITAMNHYRIQRIVLMSPPGPGGRPNRYDVENLRFALQKYPDRISLAGGGSSLNGMIQATAVDAATAPVVQKFRAMAGQLLEAGAVAFGEIAIHHLSLLRMGPRHPYESVPADHPLLLVLADIAAKGQRPIDVHLDLVPADMPLPPRPIFNPATPARLTSNRASFEQLLDHNPAAKIVWAHAGTDPLGTRNPGIERELLQRHANLFMSLRLVRGGPGPSFALDDNATLKPGWLALLRDFPDRFVLGSDFFYGGKRGPGEDEFQNFWRLLCQLPDDLAAKISFRNAAEIYRLPEQPTPNGSLANVKFCSNAH
jgi:predicted TIM-barrel fold metal-dependent hydrolase